MIQCHTFNSFTRLDLREGGPYVLSQFVGGMAAPLFLFMAGMTLAFQMESAEKRTTRILERWISALRRGGYVMGIALLFRLTNWIASLPHADTSDLLRVDILNCMGAAMLLLAPLGCFEGGRRIRVAAIAGLAIAALAPVVSNLPWDGLPGLLRDYLVPSPRLGRFPLFPCASYVAFGIAAGGILKRTAPERLERSMQWSMLIAFGTIFVAQYFSNIPFSIYPNADFWRNSPALIFIRVGIILVALALSYLWTEHWAGTGWSWMETLGKNSLLVYWVHVMMVYGDIAKPIKRAMSIPQTTAATLLVVALMAALSAAKLKWWRGRRGTAPAAAIAAHAVESPR